jgi:hypothetical protein
VGNPTESKEREIRVTRIDANRQVHKLEAELQQAWTEAKEIRIKLTASQEREREALDILMEWIAWRKRWENPASPIWPKDPIDLTHDFLQRCGQ